MTIDANGVRGENEYGAYEEFLLLDDAGYMWIADIYDSLSMGHAMVPTTLPAYSLHDNVYNYCSMVVADDGMVFVSIYTGEGSVLYMHGASHQQGRRRILRCRGNRQRRRQCRFGSLYLATANHQEEGQAAATAQIERTEPVQASSVSAEELAAREAPARPQSTAAKDRDRGYHRAGMPMAWRLQTNSGTLTVAYDPAKLTLRDVDVQAAHSAANTAVPGTVVIAYADREAVAAGSTVADLTFVPVSCQHR